LRAAYAEAVAGASFDQSFQLEPTEVAGINQAFRSVIPEAVAGANAGARFDIAGLSLEQRFQHGTYVALTAGWLGSRVNRQIGAFVIGSSISDRYGISSTPQQLDYTEESLTIHLHQLLGPEWAVQASYQISRAELSQRFSEIPTSAHVDPLLSVRGRSEGILQRVDLGVIYNHRRGFFAEAQGQWWAQANRQDATKLPGENFWQANVLAGWRSPQRRAELTLGVLNLTGQDYQLSPLNYSTEPTRERTFLVRLRLSL
jgi:hypothetical protein